MITRESQPVLLSPGLEDWHELTHELINEGAQAIALRGADSGRGILPDSTNEIHTTLREGIDLMIKNGTPVILLGDGHADNRRRPDIGSVFGRLADAYAGDNQVLPIVVQNHGQYKSSGSRGRLASSRGTEYQTYIFPDETPDGHNALTQSTAWIRHEFYSQYYIGPADQSHLAQVKELQSNIRAGDDSTVHILNARHNPEVGNDLRRRIANAPDEAVRQEMQRQLRAFEAQPFGAFFTALGQLAFSPRDYPNVYFQIQDF